MAKFKSISRIIEATQWFKNGDHPLDYASDIQGSDSGEMRVFTGAHRKKMGWEGEIVRYYRHPEVPGDRSCVFCSKTMHEHGWIDGARNGGLEYTVCPGDWIITRSDVEMYPCKPDLFAKYYKPVPE
jgi:hypothetical protein